ncbi:MAG: ribonuclease HI [Anaerolineae bacterium]|nr:ribonuclease HI [Anaerolineae bacterium]
MEQEQKVIIYTDGGCKPNPGAGGWAALLIYGDMQKPLYGYDARTTNNRMELTAAVRALSALKRPCAVEFHTDSQYMRNGITSWIDKWRQNGWRTANKKPVENQDLWMRLYELTQQHTIDWKWVRGHAGNQYNERVDQLATRAREQRISSEA